MLIDLHCHTAPRSQCSNLSPEELVALARQRGLDGVCITEHDAWWSDGELEALRRQTGLLVLGGIELTTDLGHVLGFGLPPAASGLVTARQAFEHASANGGLLFLAHPARDGLLKVTAETLRYFESVEGVNGSDSRLQNMAATGLAKGFRLPAVGGSDAHTPAEVGRAATRFYAPVHDQESLVAALGSRSYEAVRLE